MFSFLKRLFFPTRFDACCIVIATHWLSVVLIITLTPLLNRFINGLVGLECINMVAAATWIGLAASYCWKGCSKKRCRLLLVSSIASLVFAQAWFWLSPRVSESVPAGFQYSFSRFTVFAEANTFLHQFEGILIWALVAFGVLLLSLLFRFVAGKYSKIFRSVSGSLPADRTKGLLITALVLFVGAMIARLPIGRLGILPTVDQFDMTGFFLSVVVGLMAWLVALCWFPYAWSTTRKPVQKVLAFLLVLAGFVVLAINVRSIPFAFVLALAAISFVGTVVGIAGCRVESEEGQSRVFKPAFRPSLVSLATVLGLSCAISVPLLVGTGTLAMALSSLDRFGSPPTIAELTQLIVNSTRARWNSGGRIEYVFDPVIISPTWKVKFDETAPKDLLASLPLVGAGGVELDGMTPEFDASVINSRFVVLKDCRLTHTQLEHLLTSVSAVEIRGSLSIVDDGHRVDPGVVTSISIRDAEPGVTRKFFDATNCCSQLSFVVFSSPVTIEDWSVIEDASQIGLVQISAGFASDFKLPKKRKPLGRALCYTYGGSDEYSLDPELAKELFLNTNLHLNAFTVATQEPETHWKLLMLRGMGQSMEYLFGNSQQTIDEFTKEIGMAYELEGDAIRSLYFPTGVKVGEISQLKDLRVLSFDPGWLNHGANAVMIGNVVATESIEHLGALESLEELYFGSQFIPQDLAVLKKLSSLKHLQIPSVVRSVTGPVGFDDCPSLESITFFGVPDNQSWREVSRLPNLKRLTIIDHESDEKLTPEYIGKVKKKFPGVEVSLLKLNENESQIPKAFRDYRDDLRKEMRSDTKWLDGLLKEN